MIKINQFEIRTVELDLNEKDNDRLFGFHRNTEGFKTFEFQIYVDGIRLEPSAVVDMECLLDSIHHESTKLGTILFTCGCGHSGCVYIDDAVNVSHHDGLITWHYPHPLVTKNRSPNHPFGESVNFAFERSEMEQQCKNAIQFIRDASSNDFRKCRIPVLDKPISKLLSQSRFKWVRRMQ